jgi:hypothetical protein
MDLSKDNHIFYETKFLAYENLYCAKGYKKPLHKRILESVAKVTMLSLKSLR